MQFNVAPDYLSTVILLNLIPDLVGVIAVHIEIFQLLGITGSKKDQHSKKELYEASKQIHDMIIQILKTQEGNKNALLELDSLMMNKLSNEPCDEEIQQYLDDPRRQKKIKQLNNDQLQLFNQLNNYEKCAILELKLSDRKKALEMPKKYFEFFGKLKPNQRIIFLQKKAENAENAFRVLSTLNETDWQTTLFYSLPDLKRFIQERITQFSYK